MAQSQLLAAFERADASAGTARKAVMRSAAAILAMMAVLAVVLVSFSSRDPSRRVTRDEFGPAWPLTVPSATLTCQFRDEITVTSRGTTYTLTPSDGRGAYDDIARIRADGAAGVGKKELTPLIQEGLMLCR